MDVALPQTRPPRTSRLDGTGDDDLTAHVRRLLGRRAEVKVSGVWAHVDPPGVTLPEQGWKLHISATDASALDVLSAVVPLLARAGVSFKFAADRGVLRVLNSATVDRGSGGKFLTVYPADDETAVELAAACHEATASLEGPAILSDRAYRPGSLVHYRYGGFTDRHSIDPDGLVVYLIRDPAGNLVPDERRPGRWGPAWATDPFQPAADADAPAATAAAAAATSGATAPSGPVTLGGRYLMRAALRHSNKGGVYLATDQLRDVTVVVKEGRPYVAGSPDGDARDRIRHEAAMLVRLQGTGCVPGFVDLFDAGGHTFLVTEHVDDLTLRETVEDAFYPPDGGLPAGEVAALAVRLAAVLDAVHAAGIVLRDFNPNNILVGDDGEITLVDFEFAHPAGRAPEVASGTPGYSAPEEMRGEPSGVAGDHWSLGATLAFVATGADPYFPADSMRPWTDPGRLAAWLDRLVDAGHVDARLAGLIVGLMAADPDRRLGPDAVVPALTAEPVPDGQRPSALRPRAVADPDPSAVTAWLLSTMGTGTGGHVWPTGPTGQPLDPANVQSGASGVGLYLCRALRAGGAGRADTSLRTAVAATAGWVSDRIARGPNRPPGLHFGLSGMVWFLTEAGAVLGRDELIGRANDLALGLPARSLNPDVSHGTAGIGMAQLHQWLRTGDDRFLARAFFAADHLVNTVEDDATWSVPEGAPTRLAGTTSYGFAHGSAGIGTFLLYAGAATGESRFTEVGLRAVEALLPHAVLTTDGAAFWPVGPDNDELWPHWCNGSTGVGTALLRAFLVTGDRRLLGAAEAAALAGIREAWRSSTVQCHGLAGDAELLLDLTAFAPDPGCARRWEAMAADAAESLWVRRRRDGGHVTFADDTGASVSAGLGTGVAGVGAFLLRRAVGGPRFLMLDELLTQGMR